MAKKKAENLMPGRPALVRGRSVVITIALTPDASALASTVSAASLNDMSLGDIVEILVSEYGGRLRLPKEIAESSGRWAPKRFKGRNIVRRFRMSDQAVARLDAICSEHNAVRGDVIEGLIRLFANKMLTRKGKR